MAEQAEPVAGLSTASATFFPYDISPSPNSYKRGETSRQGWPKCSSQMLTSTPYMKDLEVCLKRRASKKKAKVPTKNVSKSDDDLPTKEHQPDYTNVECILCASTFCEDVKGEEWVQCMQCEMWAHVECS
ncbi:hypothetical protein PR048_026940, partial [Dryococelus australis]